MSPSLALDIEDAEIATTLRQYGELNRITLAGVTDASHILREEDGCFALYAGETCQARYAMPLALHTLGRAVEQQLASTGQATSATPLHLTPTLQLDGLRRVVVNTENGEVLLSLTEKECALLEAIMTGGAEGIDREALLARIWGYHPDTQTRTFESTLYRLRQKLAGLPGADVPEIQVEQGCYRIQSSS